MKQSTRSNEAATGGNPDVVIVRTAIAAKLSPRGESGISYQLGRVVHVPRQGDCVGDAVYIRIEKNHGAGSCSKEWVPIEKIRAALTPAMLQGKPFKSDAMTPAYVGRSQCNSGFLVAALRAEGIFRADGEHKGMSRLVGDLDAWESSIRTAEPPLVDGRPATAKLHPEPKESRFRPKQASTEAAAIDATGATDAEGARGPIPRKVRRMKQPKGDATPEQSATDSAAADGAPTEQSDGAETAVA